MKNKLFCLLILAMTAMSCKKGAATEETIDKGDGGGTNSPLTNVYVLAYEQQGSSALFTHMLYKDRQTTAALRSYSINSVYTVAIHNTLEANNSEGFNYLGLEYVNNRTRVVYLKKDMKEILSAKTGVSVPDNYDEQILDKKIYNGDLYVSVRQVDTEEKHSKNYCYKVTKAGIASMIALTNEEFYGLEFLDVLPTGVVSATVGSPYADGKFRIYKGSTEVAAIDFTTENFKYTYVNSFHMKNDNEAEMVFMAYRSTNQPAFIYYATYNLTTKTLTKYKTDFSYDEYGYSFTGSTYDNGKFYLASYETGKNKCWALKIEFDANAKRVAITKATLKMGVGAVNSTTNKIFAKNGNIFVTGEQGGKYSYWQNGEWVDPAFQGQNNDYIADMAYIP